MYMISLLLLTALLQVNAGTSSVNVEIPTVEQETEYVWRTIIAIPFFEQNGYDISLPEGELIESLKEKARTRSLSDQDYEQLGNFIRNEVYDRSDYQKGYEEVSSRIPLLNEFIMEIENSSLNWDFKLFESYTVTLTLYGPGGSYNPDNGTILLYTTTEGDFKQYDNPANTIIHEVVHIGIEASIVQRYQVPHGLKERIVDTFVYHNFKDRLPSYRIQNMGDPNIDPLISKKSDMENLGDIVRDFMDK